MLKFIKEQGKGIAIGAICTLLTMATLGVTFADTVRKNIEVELNSVKILVNGQSANSDNFVYDGRTYVQLRDLTTMMGKDIGWNNETQTVSINDKTYSDNSKNAILSNLKKIYGYYQYTDNTTDHFFTIITQEDESSKGTFNEGDAQSMISDIAITSKDNSSGTISITRDTVNDRFIYSGTYTINGTEIIIKGNWTLNGENKGTFYMSNKVAG